MLKEGNFGYHEAISLIVITITIKAFFSSPAVVSQIVGTAGWYLTLISALVAAFFFMFQYRLLKRFPNMNTMEINDVVLGRVFGPILSLLTSAFFIIIASIDMREFVEVLKIFVLPESPPSFVMIIFTLSLIVLSFMGLETIARFARFIIYVLAVGFISVILLSFTNFESYRLFPVLGYGLDKTIINGFLRSSFYGAVTVIGIFACSLHGPKEIKRIGFLSIIISGIFTSIAILAFVLVFPYTTAKELISPMYGMASMIDLGGFLQRLEPIFLFLWNFGTFIQVTVLFYAAVMIYCHVFKISDKRPIIFPMATLLYALNLIPKGISEVITQLVHLIRQWGWIPYFLPPIIVFIIAVIRKKRGDATNA